MSRNLLLLSACLAVSHTLSAAQRQQGQCGETRCMSPLPEFGWISNITFFPTVISAMLDWNPDPMLINGAHYRVVWREAEGIFTVLQGPRHPSTGIELRDLLPATSYEAFVCLPRFNISTDIPPDNRPPLIPECGFCLVCFETLPLNYEFLTISSSRLNETYVNVTCEVEANVDFSVLWTIVMTPVDAAVDEEEIVDLTDGDLVSGRRIAIQSSSMIVDGGTDFVIASVLIAPEDVLEMDLQCIAESSLGSDSRTFGPLPTEDPAGVTVPFPLWAIAIMVLVPLLIISILVFIIIVYCNNKKKITKEVLELRQFKSSNEYLDSNHIAAASDLPLKKSPDSEEVLDLNSMLQPEMIVDSSLLDVSTVIGQGEFGVVYKGKLRRGSVCQPVAVKSLKGIFVTESDVQNALKEITKMKNFDHPNVMTLVGVCKATAMSGGAPSIIMPYMARGSLLSYLRKERESLMPGADTDITQTGSVQKLLMQICLQISKGMAYLASLRFVHRDLAARNCMIDEKGVIKVADFGLAEDIYMRNYFRQSSQDSGVKLPLKWMAPESIKLGIFSEKSDVWSYGVTCWEVFTAGEIPYPGVHPREVVQLLEEGQHLNRPKNHTLTDSMFGVMRSCWAYRSEDRPDFEELVSSLDQELTSLAEYVDLSMFVEDTANRANEE